MSYDRQCIIFEILLYASLKLIHEFGGNPPFMPVEDFHPKQITPSGVIFLRMAAEEESVKKIMPPCLM